MAEPFKTPEEPQEGLLSRVTRRNARASAVRDLERLLAEAETVRDVALDAVSDIGRRHGIELDAQLRTARRNLYRRFLEHCLQDYMLSELELEDLGYLRDLLHLEDADVAHVQQRVARDVYGKAVEAVLEDHLVDDEEKRFLKRLRGDLDVSEFHASQMFEQEMRRSQQRRLAGTSIESAFLRKEGGGVELAGTSRIGLAEAIRSAVDGASGSFPDLAWADLAGVRVRISDGQIVQWRVTLEAGTGEPEEG